MKQFFFLLMLISSSILFAQDNSDCFDCHNDESLTGFRNDKEVSFFVNENKFAISAHSKVKCIECHSNFDPENIPHKEGKNIYKVDCAKCHKTISEQTSTDIHHRLKEQGSDKRIPDCITCHSYHYVTPIKTISEKTKFYCTDCHKSGKNAEGFHKKVFVSNSACADCHDDVEDLSTKLAKSVHTKVACADCHTFAAANLEDHEDDADLARQTSCETCHKTIFEEHSKSIHGLKLAEGITDAANCSSCHGSHEIVKVTDPQSPVSPKNLAETCGNCHDDPAFEEKFEMSVVRPGKMYTQSVHGKHVAAGDKNAPNCTSCHGVHDIKNRVQEGSKISAINLPNTCENCHKKEVEDYKNSIHWFRVQRGIKDAPVCNDCHNEHSIEEITDQGREANRLKMQKETCIGCHENSRVANKYGKDGNQVEEYLNSYHGLAAMRGDKDAALCIDCHNVHSILPSKNLQASTNAINVTKTCQRCHKDATEIFSKSYSHKSDSESARVVENFVSNIYFWLIIAVIGGMFVHNLLIFLFETRKKKKKRKECYNNASLYKKMKLFSIFF
ncbi:MAG: hypothetical protein H6613_04715 [Ignavibacteriales bacterium]|nr:hypothetical protein [Ignavibacteriales bacterium]